MHPTLQSTVPASEIIDRVTSGMSRRFLQKLLQTLEQYTGALYVPEPVNLLYQVSPVAARAFDILKKNGVIDRIHRHDRTYPDEPNLIAYTTYSSTAEGMVGYGRDFFSEEAALWRALAEGTERALWRDADPWKDTMRLATYTEMSDKALDIFAVTGFSDSQRIAHLELRYTPDTPFRWIPVRAVGSGKTIWCPAQLMSAYYARTYATPRANMPASEPMIRWTVSTGLATGATHDDALLAGICEVIERDAFMITHLNKLTPERFDLAHLATQNERIRELLARLTRHNLTAHAWKLPTDMPTTVVLGAIVDETGVGPRITFGARATFDVAEGIINALTEAFSLRVGIRGSFRETPVTPPLTKKSRVAYWAQKENLDDLAHLFAGTPIQHTLETPPPRSTWLSTLKEALHTAGMEAYYVDFTTEEMLEIPLYTVNVLISEMQPLNLEERVRYDSGTRLNEVPKKLGYTPAAQPNPLPHPFS